jgi:Predicted membrane protein
VANLKYGLWTAAVLLMFSDGFLSYTSTPMYLFLLLSHLGMAAQAFLLDEASGFSRNGLIAGAAFYFVNDVADYTSLLGAPLHTLLPGQEAVVSSYTHTAAHGPAGAVAAACTLVSVVLLAVRIKE